LSAPGPDFKTIPDSELVYGPPSEKFDVTAFINEKNGYLSHFTEEVEGQILTGIQIVQRVAEDFSVNPRLLLAVLEYRSGWVTQSDPSPQTLDYPVGITDEWRKGLYQQLSWAANNLNRGYYLWRVNGVSTWSLADGTVVPVSPLINAGTAGVQQFFALLYGRPDWEVAVQRDGLFAVYMTLFGYPFDFALEPLLPSQMEQPPMHLPFEANRDWAYTGGPHGSWGDGSAWGALDFAPGGDELGCVTSNEWVVAVANGPILRAANGAVIQDLDGYAGQKADGLEQTGWIVLYMHIESRDRVQPGTYLQAGERIGHPSCEGGFSSGTHVHLARRYNGEWISADQTLPFILDGWVSRGGGDEYDGFLQLEDIIIEAIEGYFPENTIRREP
jgi:murein DD-endopeptidase MepM/ murein hydrolase activator NlpD